jgi:hypothetical protein
MSEAIPEEFVRRAKQELPESAIGSQAITPGSVLPKAARAIYVGVGGDAVITHADGSSSEFKGLITGLVYPISVLSVATGATATNLVALY